MLCLIAINQLQNPQRKKKMMEKRTVLSYQLMRKGKSSAHKNQGQVSIFGGFIRYFCVCVSLVTAKLCCVTQVNERNYLKAKLSTAVISHKSFQ